MTKEEKIELQREQISSLISKYSQKELFIGDKSAIKEINDAVTRVFQLEIQSLGKKFDPNNLEENDISLELLKDAKPGYEGACHMNVVRDEDGNAVGKRYSIAINMSTFYDKLSSYRKEDRIAGCKYLFRDVFHEIRHYRQDLMMESGVSSKETLMFVRDQIMSNYLNKFYSEDEITGNYHEYSLETDAEATAFSQYVSVMGEEDTEFEKIRDTKIAEHVLSRYKIDTESYDGHYYNSNGLQERDDATVSVMDEILQNKDELELLEIFPILQKEYNPDGSKKTIKQLIQNMNKEKQDLLSTNEFSDIEKDELITSCEEMYTELIYRQIEREEDEQLREAVEFCGKDAISEILKMMQVQLEKEKNKKIQVAENLRDVKTDGSSFVIKRNRKGTMQIEENGRYRTIFIDEMIQNINPDVKDEIINYCGRPQTLRELVHISFKQWIPESGMYVLKDGTPITVKDFIEKKIPEIKDIGLARNFLKETVLSEPDAEYVMTCNRLEKYYGKKNDKLDQIYRDLNKGEHIEERTGESLPISTGVEDSLKNIAINQKARDIKQGSTEIKTTFMELDSPMQTKEDSKNLDD